MKTLNSIQGRGPVDPRLVTEGQTAVKGAQAATRGAPKMLTPTREADAVVVNLHRRQQAFLNCEGAIDALIDGDALSNGQEKFQDQLVRAFQKAGGPSFPADEAVRKLKVAIVQHMFQPSASAKRDPMLLEAGKVWGGATDNARNEVGQDFSDFLSAFLSSEPNVSARK